MGKAPWRGCWWGLETPQHGDIAWRGTPLTALKGEAIGAFRRDIQLVFQDAFSAVNPRKTVREIVSEPLRHLLRLSREARSRRVEEMLLAVDLAPSLLDKRRRSSAADSCSASAWHAPWRYGRSC
ncbi:nickel transport ATP-binding protein NikE [Klebsiella variicola]|uniref:Nickel transport ATP-binding protein NikE n=1 Tax=Klebsiella variicola TaxID=244366 RepID=A0A7H4M995_KLEVA|nr:nickel transport ATP-binding protein NikE [Klebsiella variicola]